MIIQGSLSPSLSLYIYIYVYIYMCIHIYIYIYIWRRRHLRRLEVFGGMPACVRRLFIGWANNHFNYLQFINSLDTQSNA